MTLPPLSQRLSSLFYSLCLYITLSPFIRLHPKLSVALYNVPFSSLSYPWLCILYTVDISYFYVSASLTFVYFSVKFSSVSRRLWSLPNKSFTDNFLFLSLFTHRIIIHSLLRLRSRSLNMEFTCVHDPSPLFFLSLFFIKCREKKKGWVINTGEFF